MTEQLKEQTLTDLQLLESLRNAVRNRNSKIDDVTERIDRQEDHIRKTREKKNRFVAHRSRWRRQNKRDISTIKALELKLKVDSVDLRAPAPKEVEDGVSGS